MGGGGEDGAGPERQSPKEGKINVLKENIYFSELSKFELLEQQYGSQQMIATVYIS